MRLSLLAVLLPVFLAGCATQPVSNAEATHVAATAVLAPSLLVVRPSTHPVTIKRDSGSMGGACSTRVFVDGQPVADISVREKVVVYLTEGEHIFSARPNGICAGGVSETRAAVRSSAPLNLRVAYGSNGEFFINVTAF